MKDLAAERGGGKRIWLTAVAVLAVLPHLVVLGNPLLHDAPIAILNNAAVQSAPIAQLWTRDFWGLDPKAGTTWSGSWRPLVSATWAAQARSAGNAAWLYHAGDLGIHAACAAALFALMVALGTARAPGAALTLLFAWHPVTTEAVASVVGRADLLAAFFLLVALLMQQRGKQAAAVLALGASLLCKESAVGGPLVCIALTWACGDGRRRYGFQAACLGLLASYLILRGWTLGEIGAVPMIDASDNPLVGAPLLTRGASALALMWLAARLIVFPIGLSHLYATGSLEVAGGFGSLGPIAGLGLVASMAALAWRVRDSRVRLGITLFLFPLLPALHLVTPSGVLFAERWLYLPVAGVMIAIAGLAPERRSRTVVAGAVAVALLFAALALRRDRQWRSMEPLVEASLAARPDTAKLWNEKGLLAMSAGRPGQAAHAFTEATRRVPQDARPWFHLAGALEALGDIDGAERAWRRVVDLAPAGAVWVRFAQWQAANGLNDRARATLEEARGRFPDDPEIRKALAEFQRRN